MVWAVLVALGVAVVSMTLFGARLTRRPHTMDAIVEDLDSDADPNDPWAAWKPRPLEDLDRPRQRIWPVLAAFTGLIMVGAGFAGARQTIWAAPTAEAAIDVATPRPYTVEVELPPTPTLKPTPKPTPTIKPATPAPAAPTPAPVAQASAPTTTTAPAPASGSAPTVSGSSNCAGGTLSLSYSAEGTDLSWIAVYVDGKTVKGGPISGSSHASSYSGAATPGDHDLEVVVEDKAGRTARKQFQSHCA